MKKLSRFCSLLLVLGMLTSVCFSTMAQASGQETRITQFDYTIYDQDGNVRERGTTPDLRGRYSWSGVKLANGDTVAFDPPGSRNGFNILEGQYASFLYLLDKAVTVRYEILRTSSPVYLDWTLYKSGTNTTIGASTSFYAPQHALYSFFLTNYSSEIVTVRDVTVNYGHP